MKKMMAVVAIMAGILFLISLFIGRIGQLARKVRSQPRK